MRGMLPNVQVGPSLATILPPEQPHTKRQEWCVRRVRRNADGMHIQHSLGGILCQDRALQMRQLGQLHQLVAEIDPTFTTVVAAHRAVYFHAGPNRIGL